MGTIRENSPRAKDWKWVFGSLSIPLKSPLPVRADGPDGTLQQFYEVDVAKLSASQVERVVVHIAHKHELDADAVRRDLEDPTHGLPILAEDIMVSFDPRLVL